MGGSLRKCDFRLAHDCPFARNSTCANRSLANAAIMAAATGAGTIRPAPAISLERKNLMALPKNFTKPRVFSIRPDGSQIEVFCFAWRLEAKGVSIKIDEKKWPGGKCKIVMGPGFCAPRILKNEGAITNGD